MGSKSSKSAKYDLNESGGKRKSLNPYWQIMEDSSRNFPDDSRIENCFSDRYKQ